MYVFRWKRGLFWQKRSVVGHRYEDGQDKMVLFSQDGSVEEIARWSRCSAKLGTDWVLAMKKEMEKKAGTSVPLGVG